MNSFLQAFLSGDPRTLKEIYESETSDQIRNDVIYGGGTPEDAEDVLVLSILRVQKLIKSGKYQDENFYGYLRRVSRFVYKEERRKKYKSGYYEKEQLVNDPFSLLMDRENMHLHLREEIEDLEAKVELNKVIDTLDNRSRRIIKLRYFEGLSFVEIGKVMNINQANVVHFRIVEKLRKKLKEKKGS